MINLILFGPPGSGKGTQSEKLIEKYDLFHISTGDVLRKEIVEGSKLGKIADAYISRGELIPDDLMVDILRNYIKSHQEASKGVIFDGFPRTVSQAEALGKLLNDLGTELHAVVGLEVDDDEIMDRLVKRGRISGRSDDNPETIKKRLEVYHKTTQPLKEYYHKSGHYKGIKGVGNINKIFEEITSHIDPILKK